MTTVAVIDYGAGNLTSLRYALQRCGASEVLITKDKHIINSADRVIFPGVGHARFAMDKLQQTGLSELIPRLEQPVLGICLGMQLMCRHSEEGDVIGLGIFDAEVKRFNHGLKVPHMGWNIVQYDGHPQKNQYYYFVHSYYAADSDDTLARSEYGLSFSAVLAHHNFLGCQFHPEKSGESGEQFLKSFLQ
ncbi:MAG TPA: imidazole glycerol phosphate synthase subunit HisH [Bacteroidales bacterium]|nr:imidazole glycerol phosphate synthase subunit HisH [Bacteroidales bacterium]